MPRIQLAHWHKGHPPGAELDVTDDELAQLKRDGRVAAVLDVAAVGAAEAAEPEPAAEASQEAEAVAGEPPTPSRRRR